MKRSLSILLVLLLCLGGGPMAGADSFPAREPLCDPGEVDLSGVTEAEGRLVGEIRLPQGLARGRILVDCPVPTGFSQEQQKKLSVEYRPISEDEVGRALEAIGQEAEAGAFQAGGGGIEPSMTFTREPYIPHYYFWGTLSDASASEDKAYQKEYRQAKDALRALVKELGGEVCENLFHTNRLDEEHFYPYSDTEYSTSPDMRKNAVAHFVKEEAKYGRKERNLTLVSGLFQLYGLPVMYQYVRPLGADDWTTGVSSFHGAVRDDGQLCHLELEGLPVVTGCEPMPLPQLSWRELLAQAVANGWCVSNASAEDETYEDNQGLPVTRRASYAVISGLHPCWVGMEENTLVPGWYMNIDERVVQDDSLLYPWSSYGDTETMTCIQ